jgi:hypothetical protein
MKAIKEMSVEERREYNRLRKQEQRQREKQQSEKYIAELEESEEREIYKARNLHFFGEQSPGVDAKTHDAELAIHREFLQALDQPGVQPGETLRTVAKRCWEAWLNETTSWTCSGDERKPNPPDEFLAAFNRTTQQFDGFDGFDGTHWRNQPFDSVWYPPNGCTGDEAIDVSILPDLPQEPRRRNGSTKDSDHEDCRVSATSRSSAQQSGPLDATAAQEVRVEQRPG